MSYGYRLVDLERFGWRLLCRGCGVVLKPKRYGRLRYCKVCAKARHKMQMKREYRRRNRGYYNTNDQRE